MPLSLLSGEHAELAAINIDFTDSHVRIRFHIYASKAAADAGKYPDRLHVSDFPVGRVFDANPDATFSIVQAVEKVALTLPEFSNATQAPE